jgi:23S rRNA (adenine2503-C2)-methyltransferase
MTTQASQPGGERPNLFGLDRRGLAEVLERYACPAFHAGQIYRWLYARRLLDVRSWTDLPAALRERLERDTVAAAGTLSDRTGAADGTVKYRVDLPAGDRVECVRMVQGSRTTLCISSQVGCALDCDFCLTGKMGFRRHLTPGEIVGQVALMIDDGALHGERFNVVFMGMGEPLHNYDGVMAAFRLLTDAGGFGLSRRRVTISTAGLAREIERLAAESVRPRLAVSLNATTDELRDRLMPVNRRYGLERLLEACRTFARETGERFTFEYVLLQGVNDTEDDVRRLAALLRGVPAKVNLIPFNPVAGWLAYAPPPRDAVLGFRDRLLGLGVAASIRWSRGSEARAACGQLALLPGGPS